MDSISRPAVVWWWSRRELRGQPNNTPHGNGTDDRAQSSSLYPMTRAREAVLWNM